MKRVTKSVVSTAIFAAVAALGTLSVQAADLRVIHAGQLLATPGEAPKSEQTVVIEDGRIVSVHNGYLAASEFGDDASVIDLKDQFVMPGMMDMHVHIQMELGPQNDSEKVRLSSADIGMQSVGFARKLLHAGFTTVRDMGNEFTHLNALRDGVEKGWIEGPRIIAGRMIAATGGHGDIDGMRHDLLEKYTSSTMCNGGDDCLRAVREAVKYGADVIKITATGGVLSDTTTGTAQQMTDAEMGTIVETAHGLGRKVAAHAHAAGGINAALRAGVDSIEHGTYADDESIRLFKENGSYLVPTLLAGDTVVQMAKAGQISSAAISAKALRVGADLIENFGNAYRGGVKIAFGTDSGVSKHGINAQEAVLMNQAGMPEMDVIKSATVVAADLAGMSDSLGTISEGKHADIIAMDKNPLDDITALTDVSFVMKAGNVFKNE
ncbi:metal-dependent hydrolase family protein [Kordiimonas aquimaris]|uniref:metal-dependent hydrolase family protein n=1 Tax=Kordiimonas aquimaris TaxID=707591 RepID=UPI0021D12E3E|nr:amidohydrolase family protein [Kordiimonas aquimaris]